MTIAGTLAAAAAALSMLTAAGRALAQQAWKVASAARPGSVLLAHVARTARPEAARQRRKVEADERPRMEAFMRKGGFVHELTAEWACLVGPNRERKIREIGSGAQERWDAIQKSRKEHAARGGN